MMHALCRKMHLLACISGLAMAASSFLLHNLEEKWSRAPGLEEHRLRLSCLDPAYSATGFRKLPWRDFVALDCKELSSRHQEVVSWCFPVPWDCMFTANVSLGEVLLLFSGQGWVKMKESLQPLHSCCWSLLRTSHWCPTVSGATFLVCLSKCL